MNAFLIWLGAYVLVLSVAFIVARKQTGSLMQIPVVHGFLLLSILLFVAFGARLALGITPYLLVLLVLSVAFSYVLLKQFGLLYFVSALIQQVYILLAASVLFPVTGVWIAALLTAMVFGVAHLINPEGWWWKAALTFLWGTVSIVLYAWLHTPLLTIALHTLGGAVLIRTGLLFTKGGNAALKRYIG